MSELPDPLEFLETTSEGAREVIKLGLIATGAEITEHDWDLVEAGIAAGIVAAVEALRKRNLLKETP